MQTFINLYAYMSNMHVCLHACMRACMRACMHACEAEINKLHRTCMHAHVQGCPRTFGQLRGLDTHFGSEHKMKRGEYVAEKERNDLSDRRLAFELLMTQQSQAPSQQSQATANMHTAAVVRAIVAPEIALRDPEQRIRALAATRASENPTHEENMVEPALDADEIPTPSDSEDARPIKRRQAARELRVLIFLFYISLLPRALLHEDVVSLNNDNAS